MGGQDAVRGFEYQFFRTLEYALHVVGSDASDVTGIRIEGAAVQAIDADADIVDFALVGDEGNLTVAQVKSGRPGTTLSASSALVELVRLLEHLAHRYLLVTNRAATQTLSELSRLIGDRQVDLREAVLSLVARSKIADTLRQKDAEFWHRLRRAEVVLDTRDVEQIREDIRTRVRTVRHKLAPSAIGWDATGLLTGYLVSEVMARATAPEGSVFTIAELAEALGADPDVLRGLLHQRDWAVHVPTGPRATDIARPDLLSSIAQCLPTPVRSDTAPVCLLSGLSGIGKSSLAAAWADEHADAYAAILWVDASGSAQVEASFAVIADWFHTGGVLTDAETALPVRQRVFAALARTTRPWLMVFDNCADQSVVHGWIPPRGRGHTIVTSTDQNRIPGANTATVPVSGMTGAEATRMLARRILGDRTPDDEEAGVLGRMASRLAYWPLALELAAAYLVGTLPEETGDLTRRVAEYERLLHRSMDDLPSVPEGYPRTLVGAITLTWQRVAEREASAEQLAAMALRSAAFLASRQIPLHLLLACWTIDPRAFSSNQVRDHLAAYEGDNPPIGEVLRAVRRDSLVRADEALPLPNPPSLMLAVQLGYTVTMNDIVQAILRGIIDREAVTHQVLSRTADSLQEWMSFLVDHGRARLAVGLVGHGVEASEHAMELGSADKNIALLWGNTAGLLGYIDEWNSAARYLRAELAWLNTTDQPDVLMRMQTLVILATAHYNLADRPRDAAEQIVPLVENLFADVPTALERDQEVLGRTIVTASSAVLNLRLNGAEHPRLAAVESALEDILKIVPHEESVGHFSELRRVRSLIQENKPVQARLTAEALLTRLSPDQYEYFQALCMLAEACVSQRDWPAVHNILDRFTDAAEQGRLRRFELALLLRNMSFCLVNAMLNQEQAAFDMFRGLGHIAALCDRNNVTVQAGDRDVIAVFRALSAYFDQDKLACAEWLDQVDLDEVADFERGGMTMVMYRLLHNWINPPSSGHVPTQPFEKSENPIDGVAGQTRTPVPGTVLALDEADIAAILLRCKAQSAPAHAVGLSQVYRAGGRIPRDPLEVVVETCLALHLLGMPAHIVETALAIADHDGSTRIYDPFLPTRDNVSRARAARTPHYVAFVIPSQNLVDPVLPQLPAIRPLAATETRHRLPVVLPFQVEDRIHATVRGNILLAYKPLGIYKTQDVATVLLTLEQRTACEATAIFVALQTALALSVTSGDRVSEFIAAHPELHDLLISPDILTDLHGRLYNTSSQDK